MPRVWLTCVFAVSCGREIERSGDRSYDDISTGGYVSDTGTECVENIIGRSRRLWAACSGDKDAVVAFFWEIGSMIECCEE